MIYAKLAGRTGGLGRPIASGRTVTLASAQAVSAVLDEASARFIVAFSNNTRYFDGATGAFIGDHAIVDRAGFTHLFVYEGDLFGFDDADNQVRRHTGTTGATVKQTYATGDSTTLAAAPAADGFLYFLNPNGVLKRTSLAGGGFVNNYQPATGATVKGLAYDGKGLILLANDTISLFNGQTITGTPARQFAAPPNTLSISWVGGRLYSTATGGVVTIHNNG